MAQGAWVVRVFVAAGLLATALSLHAATPALERFEFAEPHMGTLVRLVLYAPDRGFADAAAKVAFARIVALNDGLSDYRDSSELMEVSRRSGGPPVRVSDDLFRVLSAAQQMARASGGAFDATAGPLSLLWREARRRTSLPDPTRIAVARSLVGTDKLELHDEGRTVRLRVAGMQLDLGGIAKGFAADEAAAVLRRGGIERALVAAGGDVVAMNAPPGADGWRVAVAALDGADRPPAGYLTLRDAAVSTSGDAEQFMVVDGVRYSHIFDPRTGRALTGRLSVTVVGPNGTTSDALATAVSVLGGERGTRLVDQTPGAAALIVDSRNGSVRTHASRRWRALGGFPAGDQR
jgi:thiamine biosynthesis lipoprotein